MVPVDKGQGIPKVRGVELLGTINVCTKFYGNLFKGWIKVLDGLSDIAITRAITLAGLEIFYFFC